MTTIGWTVAIATVAAMGPIPTPGHSTAVVLQQTPDGEHSLVPDKETDIFFSLGQYQGGPEIHMVFHPRMGRNTLELRFVKEEKVILALRGHRYSVFCTDGGILYFAHYWHSTPGCDLAAYSLTTGRELWRTKLPGVGRGPHSAYRNRVEMSRDGDRINVFGRESYGSYSEVVDKNTGKVLSHRVLR
jgi:hypothetical protein